MKLQKKGSGAPAREPVVDADTQKAMMAWYYKKQEQDKVRFPFVVRACFAAPQLMVSVIISNRDGQRDNECCTHASIFAEADGRSG